MSSRASIGSILDGKIGPMDPALAWAIVGMALVITELLSGTFYLLMLAVAAFGAAGVAYLGHEFPVQCIVAAVLAAAGCYAVHVYRAKSMPQRMARSMPACRRASRAG